MTDERLKITRHVEMWPNETRTPWGRIYWQRDWLIGQMEFVSSGVVRAGIGTDMDAIRKLIAVHE